MLGIGVGPSLSKDERGAVWPILPAEAFNDGTVLSSDYPLPHEDIRTSLLFFDRFDIPTQSIIAGADWCQREFERIGVLSASSLKNTNRDLTYTLKTMPFATFETRDTSEPGRWTLARPAQALGIPTRELSKRAAVALTFQNALPTFTRDVELEEVLAFKVRAWDELLALRQYLDELAMEVGENGTNSLEHSVVFRRFEAALRAHMTLMREDNRPKVWRSFKASFDLPVAAGVTLDAIIQSHLNWHILGAGALSVGIKTVKGLRRKREGSNPFEYLTSAHLDL